MVDMSSIIVYGLLFVIVIMCAYYLVKSKKIIVLVVLIVGIGIFIYNGSVAKNIKGKCFITSTNNESSYGTIGTRAQLIFRRDGNVEYIYDLDLTGSLEYETDEIHDSTIYPYTINEFNKTVSFGGMTLKYNHTTKSLTSLNGEREFIRQGQ